ncbi:MAG: hypothetical protein ABI644_02275, partial [Arenimonas sp.]
RAETSEPVIPAVQCEPPVAAAINPPPVVSAIAAVPACEEAVPEFGSRRKKTPSSYKEAA